MAPRILAIPLFACLALAASPTPGLEDPIKPMEWTINGEKREALVIPPSLPSDGGAPVVLVFHGHGGSMRAMERKGFQKQWPEAIVVCPQGLPTATPRDPEGKRSGWQPKRGVNNDRDLKFVDEILKTVRAKYKVDDRRIFATGHSNGGGFTYLLWSARGNELAAIAPVAAGAAAAARAVGELKPLPVVHVAGEKDPIVPFEAQKRTMEAVRKVNGCDPEGKSWGKAGKLSGTLFPSRGGTPFVSLIHPGGHEFPAEAPELIVRFFKEFGKRPAR